MSCKFSVFTKYLLNFAFMYTLLVDVASFSTQDNLFLLIVFFAALMTLIIVNITSLIFKTAQAHSKTSKNFDDFFVFG